MGVVIQSEVWDPPSWLFSFLFLTSLASILAFPVFSRTTHKSIAVQAAVPHFRPFQRSFLLPFTLISVIEGLNLVFGEKWVDGLEFDREGVVLLLSVGVGASLFLGTLSGVLSDVIGRKKACMFSCILYIAVAILRSLTAYPGIWLSIICLALSSSINSCSFEAWMVNEHEKRGFRQELLNDTFWLMIFIRSISLIGSQMIANSLVSWSPERAVTLSSIVAAVLAVICFLHINEVWEENTTTVSKKYKLAFVSHALNDKRGLLLVWSHASLQFAMAIFWLLWTPTTVADGREVSIGLVYTCLLGARMLGNTLVPWLFGSTQTLRAEDCMSVAYVIMGVSYSIIAYDYQEVGFLVALFSLIFGCTGIILPSLARLRSMYIPNELRAGMTSLSLAPTSVAVLLVLIQGGYYRSLENSTIMAISAVGLFSAACCSQVLKSWSRRPNHDRHML